MSSCLFVMRLKPYAVLKRALYNKTQTYGFQGGWIDEIPAIALPRSGPRKRIEHHGRRPATAYFAARRQPSAQIAGGGTGFSTVRARGPGAHAHHRRGRGDHFARQQHLA